jgi:hypothetical protein
MGGNNSKLVEILNQAAARQRPQPSQDPVVVCNTRKVELNQLRTDMSTKQSEVDGCDPAGKATRIRNQFIQENADFINKTWPEFNGIQDSFHSKIADIKALVKSVGPLQEYRKEMDKEVKTLREKERQYTQEERLHRRDFLDQDPQDPLSMYAWQKTSDDKVLLGFWLCYIIGVAMLVAVGISMFAPNLDSSKKFQYGGLMVLAAFATAYVCIVYLG